jgi:hypothetical protein
VYVFELPRKEGYIGTYVRGEGGERKEEERITCPDRQCRGLQEPDDQQKKW